MVGLAGRAGGEVDQLSAVCANVSQWAKTGTPPPPLTTLPGQGGFGGVPVNETCPRPQFAVGLETWEQNPLGLAAVRLVCRDLNPDYGVVNVNIAGNGSVKSKLPPGLISCGSNCTAEVPLGLPVTLSATAFFGSKFVGWSGDCAAFGTSDCPLIVTGAMNTTATFADVTPPPQPVTLTVRVKAHPWSAPLTNGGVTGTPGVLNCQMHDAGPGTEVDCMQSYTQGTTITLTAAAGDLLTGFMGFVGACTTTSSTCAITLNGDATVDATFKSIIN
jgi:hypothetical protein